MINRSALACLATFLACTTADAQLFRAYLAPSGNDTNPCTLSLPCRLLPTAITAVANGGEIWMLDSANYNTGLVVIGKSVSILAVPGAVGSLVTSNGMPAISIPFDGLNVALRNVVIGPVAGATPGLNGILMNGASTLTVEGSVIANVTGTGVFVTGPGTLRMNDTTVRNCSNFGVGASNGATATISSSRFYDNVGAGVWATVTDTAVTSRVDVSDSVISGGSKGVGAQNAGSASTVRVSLTRSTVTRASVGLHVVGGIDGETLMTVGSSMIVDNASAWAQSGVSTLSSLGNNQMSGNGAPTGAKTPLAGE